MNASLFRKNVLFLSTQPMYFQNNFFSYFVLIITIIILLFTFFRLYFGVDFTDEAFYIAIPYRFAMGARPFIDEISFAQMSSLIILPFVKLYYWVVGSTEGIILFSRRLYFGYTLLVSGLIFIFLRSFIRWQVALLMSLTFLTLVPYGVPNLSYNTLGCGFFTIGCVSGVWTIIKQKKCVYFSLSGLFNGLAIFAYPTMLVPVLFFMGSIIIFSAEKYKTLVFYCLGSLCAIIAFIPLILNAGLDNIINNYIYASSLRLHVEVIDKINTIFLNFWTNYPYKYSIILSLILIYFSVKRNFVQIKYVILLLPLLPFLPLLRGSVAASLIYISYYFFLAPYLLLFVWGVKNVKEVFWGLWVPAFVAGITIACSSSNAFLATGLGFFQGSLVTGYFIYELFERIVSKNAIYVTVKKVILIIPPIIVLLILTYFQYTTVYRDNSILELNTKVATGPYKGMFTTVEKNEYLTGISEDLNRVVKPESKILFFDRFPVGYLLTSNIPATNTCWLFQMNNYPNMNRQATIDYYNKYNIKPDIVIRMKKVFYTKQLSSELIYPENDPLNNMVESNQYRKILSSPYYDIFEIIVF